MARWFGVVSAVLGLFLMSAPALAECTFGQYAELPVTMEKGRPIVTLAINGRDARFVLDSGAGFSTMSQATAKQYGLRVVDNPNGVLKGIGGQASLGTTSVSRLGIAGIVTPDVAFLVGGSDTGYAGLLGQNFLGLSDIEYDFPHGVVRWVKATDCKDSNRAYWAESKPTAMMVIEPQDSRQHTIGAVKINGVKIRAMIDSGASGALLMLSAAKRIGVTLDSPGVKKVGFAFGIGQARVPVWQAAFDTIDIGGEAISKPKINIVDQSFDGIDMMIGIDFFLTHRIYVDNQHRRLYFTYEGGPLFGLNPKSAYDGTTGEALDLTNKASEPTDAAGYSRRGALLATGQKFGEAIADFDKAVAMAPNDPHYLLQRATAHLQNRQLQLGMADLDKAVEVAPNDVDVRLARAQQRAGMRDMAGAVVDLGVADKALAPSSDARLQLAQAYDNAGIDEPALASYDLWLKNHPEDHFRPQALSGRCRVRGALNRDLDKAMDDCNTALKLRPGEPGIIESRALVEYKRGDFDKALADYSSLVASQPRNGLALYARSLIERRTGKTAQADTDRTAALAINPQVANRAKRFRMEE